MLNFRKDYYGAADLDGGSQIDVKSFKDCYPISCIDIRKRDDISKQGPAITTLNLKFAEGPPAGTYAFIIILSNRLNEVTANGELIRRITK